MRWTLGILILGLMIALLGYMLSSAAEVTRQPSAAGPILIGLGLILALVGIIAELFSIRPAIKK